MPDFSLDRITVSDISSVICRKSTDFPSSFAYTAMPFDRLFWVEKGLVFCESETVELSCDNILLVPKHYSCKIRADVGTLVWSISFLLQGASLDTPRLYPGTHTEEFSELFQKMEQLRRRQNAGWRLQLFSHAYRILGAVQRSVAPKKTDAGHFAEQASAYLRLHFGNHKLSIEALAERLGITRQYLRTVFARHYGVSPSQYLQELRIEYAKELLLTTMLPIEKIAGQSGFCDIFTFSKAFKLKQGETPSAFRKSYRT